MKKIPKYISNKIERYNKLIAKAHVLGNEIMEWYDKEIDKYDVEELSDDDFCNVGVDIDSVYISEDNIQRNLNMVAEYK